MMAITTIATITAHGPTGDDGKISFVTLRNHFADTSSRVVLAAIIVGAFLLFLSFSCITARRRRRQGMNPYRGTGWAAGRTPAGHAPAQYTGGPAPYYGQNTAAPPYSPSSNQGYYNQGYNQGYDGGANQSYFGGQQQGVELQQPENAYAGQGGTGVYQPPAGPPPGKKGNDGVIQ